MAAALLGHLVNTLTGLGQPTRLGQMVHRLQSGPWPPLAIGLVAANIIIINLELRCCLVLSRLLEPPGRLVGRQPAAHMKVRPTESGATLLSS